MASNVDIFQKVTRDLQEQGFAVLRSFFQEEVIHEARKSIDKNVNLLRQTRPNPSSRHLAGFHRYRQFFSLQEMLFCGPKITTMLDSIFQAPWSSIGLTDITINRSQQWHTDLLRGPYRKFLDEKLVWGDSPHSMYKALVYLQPSSSLWVVPGSHKTRTCLVRDELAVPERSEPKRNIATKTGDLVLLDIRIRHRGTTQQAAQELDDTGKRNILISSVFSSEKCPYLSEMKAGNIARLEEWDRLNVATSKYFLDGKSA